MHELIEKLQEISISVPTPLELPSFEQLVDAQEQILLPIPSELKEFLLHASDTIYGTLEPVTVSDPQIHTYLPEVTSYAWSIGLPRDLMPICQIGDDFYFINQNGEVGLWKNGEIEEEEEWESFWSWVEDVWLID